MSNYIYALYIAAGRVRNYLSVQIPPLNAYSDGMYYLDTFNIKPHGQ